MIILLQAVKDTAARSKEACAQLIEQSRYPMSQTYWRITENYYPRAWQLERAP